MNVLVTGGAGFIGSALVARLLAHGHRVAVLDDGSTGCVEDVDVRAVVHGRDIATDDLSGVFAEAQPEAVFHLAARAAVHESVRSPARCAAVNVCGTVNVLERCRDFGVRRFVLASSGGALYGDGAPCPTPESRAPSPVCPYGVSKAAAEAYATVIARLAGMRCIALRYGNVYGPRRRACGVVAAFARAMLNGAAPVIHGDGLQARDYVYIDDAVEASVRALGAAAEGAFNIGTGVSHTVRQVFEAVAAAAGYEGDAVHGEALPGEVRRSCLDAGRARRVLGWRARVAFAEGIARTVEGIRATPPIARGGGREAAGPVAGAGRS